MSIFDGLFGRRQVKLSEPGGWNLDFGTYAGKAVTPDTALQLSAAWACVSLNARTIGSLPIQLFERVSDVERRSATSHPLYQVLHDSPNAEQTAMEFWEGQATSLQLRGNAYARKLVNGGQVIGLEPWNPDRVNVYRNANGDRVYRYANPFGGGQSEFSEAEVFHLRGFGAGGPVGLAPIAYGRQTMATAIAADEVAGRIFSNGLQLSGFIELATGTKLTSEQRKDIVTLFQKFAGSTQTGKVLPLDPGMKFSPLTFTPEDAQLLESRRFNVEEVCRWFGVMPILIGHAPKGQTMFGSGVEQIMLAWLTLFLGAELERIEQAIAKQLLTPADRVRYYAEHNTDALLRADTAAQAALFASAAQNGWMSRTEIRAKKNLAPMPGTDRLTVQSNLIPLDMLGKVPAAPTGVNAIMAYKGLRT